LPRSLEQWLDHQTTAHPQSIDLGLDRLKRVLDALDWHQPAVPVITVAGTNGKGSVAAYCTTILAAAGRRVGTFTSPHLRDYRERIRVHDRLVSDGELTGSFERIEAACNRAGGISLTFFEYNALAAFLAFDAARVDAWVLEVGMGGRLDAVNVVDATVSIVVSIGLDHQEFLGNSLDAIAREKAGVFRRGRSAVVGSRTVPQELIDCALAIGALPKRLGRDFDYVRRSAEWQYSGSRWNLEGLPPPALAGDAQFGNAATAIAALEELDAGIDVGPDAVARGLASVRLTGRFQVVDSGAGRPQWILDVAHNPDAARVLRDNLKATPARGRTLAVCGILADKDAPAIAAVLRDCFDAWWLASTEGARGTGAAALAARIQGVVRAPITIAGDITAACASAAAAAGAADRIVIFGSFHTVGPALGWLEAQGLLPPSALPEYTHGA
jgi:dihydrofolate synthase/folylpolyglutamate synthase